MFKLALHTAYQMLQDEGAKLSFSKLFDANEYQRVFDLHFEKYMTGRPKVCIINLDYDCVVSLGKTVKNSELWYKRVSEAVFDVLQYGLLIDCEVTDKMFCEQINEAGHRNNNFDGKASAPISILKKKSNANAQNTPYDLELLLSIQCILYSRTWIGRKNITGAAACEDELEEFQEAALKTEFSISKELVKTNPLLNSPVPLMCFKCDCYKHNSQQISDVLVMLKPLTLSREFYQVSGFLASYIPKTVKKILSSE